MARAHEYGKHLLLELSGALHLQDAAKIEDILLRAAHLADAKVLDSYFHVFSETGGVTGVMLLAESHISIHTWPEDDYAAIDIFMCGQANVEIAAAEIIKQFEPKASQSTLVSRERPAIETNAPSPDYNTEQ